MPDGVSGPSGRQVDRRRGRPAARGRARDAADLGPALRAGSYPARRRCTPALLAVRHRPAGGDAPAGADGVPPADAARIAVARDPAAGARPARRRAVRPAGRARPAAGGSHRARPAGGPGGRVLALPGASPRSAGWPGRRWRWTRAPSAAPWSGRCRSTASSRPGTSCSARSWSRSASGGPPPARASRWSTCSPRPRAACCAALTDAPEPRNGRPVLLACTPGELHSLPLSALAAALAEHGIGVRLLGGGLPAGALAAAVRRTGPARWWCGRSSRARRTSGAGAAAAAAPAGRGAGRRRRLGRAGRCRPGSTYASDLTAAVALIGRAVGA